MLYPGRDFEKASCRDASLDKSLIVEMFDYIQEQKLNIHQMVLLRDGAKIFDAYADSFGPQTREEIYSISKSFVSVAIGILFFILQAILLAFGYSKVLPPVVAAWSANLLFLLLGGWLFLSREN